MASHKDSKGSEIVNNIVKALINGNVTGAGFELSRLMKLFSREKEYEGQVNEEESK